VFYLGAAAPVLSDGLTVVRERLPNLALNAHHGYITRADGTWDETVTEQIAAFRPDIVLVGMGMGRQESWILAHLEALAPASIVTVGACIEYVAGAVKTPPRWMGRTGLEWFFRLAEDPKRFWHRYLIEPWFVLGAIVGACARR
jgi:N-acetylglucosaminyldiphosphoundecaprenol N-acetyl-beta-D-mannosaminyltransferase